jgi:putative membrane protein
MKFNHLQIITFATAAFALSTHLSAQSMSSASSTQSTPSGQQQPTGTALQDSGTNASETSQTMMDKTFLRKAARGGLAEVKLGQLASEKAGSEDVKTFGHKMVDDHTALNDEMAPIADSMGVRVPKTLDKDDQAEYDKLSALSGADFDTEYLTVMVKDHHKDLHEFRLEAANTQDPTLKSAVEKGEKVIHEHLQMVDKLAQDKGIPIPARPGRQTPAPPAN